MYLNNCYCLYFLVLGDFGDKIKKELMELTGNCCIMSLTVVFMIAQGKIKKKLKYFFFFLFQFRGIS